jgi:hypothetical protein
LGSSDRALNPSDTVFGVGDTLPIAGNEPV